MIIETSYQVPRVTLLKRGGGFVNHGEKVGRAWIERGFLVMTFS